MDNISNNRGSCEDVRDLCEKLLRCRIGNTIGMHVDRGTPRCLKRMNTEGKFFKINCDIIPKGKRSGKCHFDSCELYTNNKPLYRLVTGYSFAQGGWARHSWVVDKDNKIVEVTDIKRDEYYGYMLSQEEAEWFCEKVFKNASEGICWP